MQRRYIQIMLARHLDSAKKGRPFEMASYVAAVEYTRIDHSFEKYLEEALAEYQGMSYDRFNSLYDRRVDYYRRELVAAVERLKMYLRELEPTPGSKRKEEDLNIDDIRGSLLLEKFSMALHEQGLKQLDKQDEPWCPLPVPVLNSKEKDVLDGLLRVAAHHEAHLQILDQVRHALNRSDTFELLPKQEIESLSDLADLLIERYPDKSRKELKDIAVRGYRVTSKPHYEYDERAYRNGLDASLKRREQKAQKKMK